MGLAAEGVKVAVNYHSSAAKAEQVVEEIKSKYKTDVIAVQADVSKSEQVRQMFDSSEENQAEYWKPGKPGKPQKPQKPREQPRPPEPVDEWQQAHQTLHYRVSLTRASEVLRPAPVFSRPAPGR